MNYFILSTVLLLADWGQTREIVRNDRYIEYNELIGARPSQTKVDLYFAGAIAINSGMALVLNKKNRVRAWKIVSIVQLSTVANNAKIGIGFNYEI